jgi:2-polyprenyl-3-methyl-5-hydroxy-6-metoxy-1,4-benzoquinol methylase
MIGDPSINDSNFNIENYEAFYEHHHFVETPEEEATKVNESIPRFGWAYDLVEELKPENLLDLGTLDGSFPITVSSNLGTVATGVDLTVDGIAIANERAKRLGLPCEFHQGTVEEWLESMARRGHKYEMITAFELLEHVKDPQRLLQLIDKVLAPGGNVLISTPAFESPFYGKDDEKNKCHIRLYTMSDADYEEANKYGNVRKATSITKEIGKQRIKEMEVMSELINLRYQ